MMMRLAVLAVLVLGGAVLGKDAAPATRPASGASTQPARMTPEQVTAFDGRFLGAQWTDVEAALKATGAVASERTTGGAGKGKFYRQLHDVTMGYPFEYGTYSFIVDGAGLIYKYQFSPAQWPAPPGSDAYDRRDPEYKLKPGNKWWLVKSVTFQRADMSSLTLVLTQARSGDEAVKKIIAQRKQDVIHSSKAFKKEAEEWEWKIIDVEAHEWFTPQIPKHQDERTD